MRKLVVAFVVIALCFAVVSMCSAQGTPKASIQQIGEHAKIDWTNLVYIVEGQGAVPKPEVVPNRAVAKLKARDYAKMDAVANLRMAIEGTTISYEATGKDYMADVTIRQRIEGFVKNVQILSTTTETFEGDTIVVVKMKAPMFGQNSPAAVFLSETPPSESDSSTASNGSTSTDVSVEASVKVVLKADKKGTPKPPEEVKATDIDPSAPDVMASAKPSEEGKPYTGVIIDATGYKLQRAMSPKIRKSDGSVVWDGVTASPDTVVEKGIVSYATSMDSARKNKRAGSNPLIIRCIGRSGGSFSCDPVLSDGDAQILIYENGKSKFLDDLNVVVIKDPIFK